MKIYNEIISRFNDKTNKWETISEDSYNYNGPLDLAAGVSCNENASNICCQFNNRVDMLDGSDNPLEFSQFIAFSNECDGTTETRVLLTHQFSDGTYPDGVECCVPNTLKKVDFDPTGWSPGDNVWTGRLFFCNNTAMETDSFSSGPVPLDGCYFGGYGYDESFQIVGQDHQEWELESVNLGTQLYEKDSFQEQFLCNSITGGASVSACYGFYLTEIGDNPLVCPCPNDGCDAYGIGVCYDDSNVPIYDVDTPCSTIGFDTFCDSERGGLGIQETDRPYCGRINSCGVCTESGESIVEDGFCCDGSEEDVCGDCLEDTPQGSTYNLGNAFIESGRYNLGDGEGAIYCDCEGTLPNSIPCYPLDSLDETNFELVELCDGEQCPPGFTQDPQDPMLQDTGCTDPLACNYNSGYDQDCAGVPGGSNMNCCVYPATYCKADGEFYGGGEYAEEAANNGLCDVDDQGNAEFIVRCPICEGNDNPPQCGDLGYQYPFNSANSGNAAPQRNETFEKLLEDDGELMWAGPPNGDPSDGTLPIEMTDLCPQGTPNCGPFEDIQSPGFSIGGCADPIAYNYDDPENGKPLYTQDIQAIYNENPITTCIYCPRPEDGSAAFGCNSGYEAYWMGYLLQLNQAYLYGNGNCSYGVNSEVGAFGEFFCKNDQGGFPLLEGDDGGIINGLDSVYPKIPMCFCKDELQTLEDLLAIQQNSEAEGNPLLLSKGTNSYTQIKFTNLGKISHIMGGYDCIAGGTPIEECREAGLQLTGDLPLSIGNLNTLVHLDLAANNLTGPIPQSLGNLTNLTNLYLDNNYFSEISNDLESGHGILAGSNETYGICNLVDILGYPQWSGDSWLTLYNNNLCPNIESNVANQFSYPECLAPDLGTSIWDSLSNEHPLWQLWIWHNLGYADLPDYQGYNTQAQNSNFDISQCNITGCMDVSARNYWPEATIQCDNCCQYDSFYHFPWGYGPSYSDGGTGSYGAEMGEDANTILYRMIQALHANQYGFQYKAWGEIDVTNYAVDSGNLDDECFIFGEYLNDYHMNQCAYQFENNPLEGGFAQGNSIINYWDGIWIRDLNGSGDGTKMCGTDVQGNETPCIGDARPLEFINRVLYEASLTNDPVTFKNYWFGEYFYPGGNYDISFAGIQWFEDFDLNGNGDLDADDAQLWRNRGRDDIADMILSGFEGMMYPESAPVEEELWEQAPVSVDMRYSKKFVSEAMALFGKEYNELSEVELQQANLQLTNNGQYSCSDGGPADICYFDPYPCGMVSELVEECTPCGNVEYDEDGEIIEGTGGDCIPYTLDTSAEGYDKISKTKVIEFNYFGESSPSIKGNSIYTASMSSSNHPYFFNVVDNDPTDSSAETQFSVAWGHYAGSGSDTGNDSKMGSSQAVYKQYSSLLLDDGDIEDGFFISSGSDINDTDTNGNRDKWIYVINFKRNKFEDNIQPGTWTLRLSGSHGNAGKTIELTDDSNTLEGPLSSTRVGYRGDIGRRFNIISGSGGNPENNYNSTMGRYGFFYPDAGVMVLGEKISNEMRSGSSGNGITSSTAGNYNSNIGGSDQLYPNTGSNGDGRNALRFINTLKNNSSNNALTLYGEKEVTEVIYLCRLTGDEFNFTNNFSILSGSGRRMYSPDTGVMNGFNTSLTSSAFTESNADSSIVFGNTPIQTVTEVEGGELFQWPGSDVPTMHGNPHTFITSVQLYDQHGEMLAIANLSKPLKKANDREVVIKVKLTY